MTASGDDAAPVDGRPAGSTSRDGDSRDAADPRAIRAAALTKRYGETVAVEDLDLWIPRGTVYGFLGPNGAGKTTTMRMLTTLTVPTSGSAAVLGHSIADREAVLPHVGYLPETPPLYDELTAREQLRYVAGLRDMDRSTADDRIEALLAAFDLAGDADRRIGAYSTGMKQKTGLIQAILHDPAVVFLDEPTAGLDPRAARTVREIIADLVADGDTTVFLSTHVLSVVDELADRVGVLSGGRLVTEGSPAALKARAAAGEGSTLEDVFIDVTGGPDDASPNETSAGDADPDAAAADDPTPDDARPGDGDPADGDPDGGRPDDALDGAE